VIKDLENRVVYYKQQLEDALVDIKVLQGVSGELGRGASSCGVVG
jgi:hypothetical protein